ncbi:hypothetical protein [Actinophytocola oryzae]|uniref:Excreted virulence factor EspC (Type VII ESX diderm) n=1 Tax=Actinophytocola oryzae TaxID=502181 RepID=A0A4R7VN29_9PSEU|nr:hypothetical protein [Actinophytocola oryzae]TDV50669.1 hypothetical protein CLV71_1069 [Actinophytocola oryzae]
MAKYNIDAINGCIQKAQDYKPKFGSVSDSFPDGGTGTTSATTFGALPSSAGLATAVDAVNDLMHDEFSAAENRLDGVAGALDAVLQSVQNDEDAGRATYNGGPRYVQV